MGERSVGLGGRGVGVRDGSGVGLFDWDGRHDVEGVSLCLCLFMRVSGFRVYGLGFMV